MPRSQYGLVDVPSGPSPMQSLTGMMQLASSMEGYQAQQHERDRAKRTEAAINEAKGDPMAAAGLLEQKGDFATARTLRDKATEIRQGVVDGVTDRLNAHKTLLGQGQQALRELQQRPELYPDLRPRLVDIASQLDPALADHIPEQYDPKAIESMNTWAQAITEATDQRLVAAQAAKEKLAAKDDAAKSDDADRKIVSNWFSVSPNQEDWDHSITAARTLGVNPDMIAKLGPTWSEQAMETARQMGLDPKDRKPEKPAGPPTTFAAAILAARSKGDDAGVEALIKLQDRTRDKGNDGTPVSGDMIDAVLKNPSVWGDLTPTVRDKMLGPLAKQGFNFPSAAAGLTDAQRAVSERWMNEQLQQLENDVSDRTPQFEDGVEIPPLKGAITPEQIASRKLSIVNSYRAQIGLRPVAALPKEWGGTGQAAPAPTPAPVAAPKPAVQQAARTATMADVTKVAARMGITEAEAKKQLAAQGVTIK